MMTANVQRATKHRAGTGADRGWRWAPLVVFVCALAVRAAFVVSVTEGFRFPDEKCYWRVAQNLREGRGLILDESLKVARAPVYPIILAASQHLFGQSLLPVRLFQAILGAVTCVLLFRLGRSMFGRVAGVCAALVATVYPFFVFYTSLVLSETLFILLLVLLVTLLWRLRVRSSWWVALIAGIVFGLAVLTRPSMLLLLPLSLVLHSVGKQPRGTIARLALLLVGFCGTMAPWVCRNYRVVGKFVPTTLQVGASLYESNSPDGDGGPAMDRIRWPEAAKGLSEYERDRYLLKQSIEFIMSDWRRFGRLCRHRCKRFWNVLPNFSGYRSWQYCALSVASYAPVLVLGIIGVLLSLRRRGFATVLLLLPVAYFAALHAVFVGSTRYRTPVMPMVMLFAGHALAVNFGIRARRPGKRMTHEQLIAGVIVLVAIAAVSALVWYVGVERGKFKEWACRRVGQSVGGDVSVGEVRFNPWSGLELREPGLVVSIPGSYPAVVKARRALAVPRLLPLVNRQTVVDTVDVDGLSILVRLKPRSRVHVPDVIAFVAKLIRTLERPTAGCWGTMRVVEGLPSEERHLALLNDWRSSVLPKEIPGTIYRILSTWREPLFGAFEFVGLLDVAGPHLDATITGRGFEITEDVVQKMPPLLTKTIQDAGITKGHVNLSVGLAYKEGTDADIRKTFIIDVRDLAFTHPEFPYPVHSVAGRIEWADSSLRLTGITAVAGGARVRLRDAQLQLPPPAGAMLTLDIECLTADRQLRACLPEEFQKVWGYYSPSGQADVTVDLEWRSGDPIPSVARTSVVLRGCGMTYDDFPLPIEHITGEIDFLEDRAQLRGLKGSANGGKLSLDECTIYYDPEGALDMPIECRDLPLNDRFKQVLGSDVDDLWQRLQPQGKLSGTYRLQKKTGKDEQYVHLLTFKPDENQVHVQGFPITLVEITGTASFTEELVGCADLTARSQETSVSLSGTFSQGRLSFGVHAPRLKLDDAFFGAMPEAVQEWRRKVKPTGHIDVKAKVAQHGPEAPSLLDGEIVLHDCAIGTKVPISDCNGRVTFGGRLGDRQHRCLAGKAHLDTLQVRGREVRDLKLDYSEEKGEVTINNIEAGLCGGSFAGELKIREPGADTGVQLSGTLDARAIRLEQLIKRQEGSRIRNLEGRLGAALTFDAPGDSIDAVTGHGAVTVREGKLGELPILLGLIGLVKLAPLDAGVFNSADLTYEVRGQTLRFTKVDLVGPVLSLHGDGVVDRNKQLNFRFRPALGKGEQGTGLAKVVNAAKDVLFPVVLKGTYDDPSWRLIPLLDVMRAIRGLAGAASEMIQTNGKRQGPNP